MDWCPPRDVWILAFRVKRLIIKFTISDSEDFSAFKWVGAMALVLSTCTHKCVVVWLIHNSILVMYHRIIFTVDVFLGSRLFLFI